MACFCYGFLNSYLDTPQYCMLNKNMYFENQFQMIFPSLILCKGWLKGTKAQRALCFPSIIFFQVLTLSDFFAEVIHFGKISMMNWSESDAVDMALFKRLRLYQLLDPNSDKVFNINVYRLVCVMIVLVIEIVLAYGMTGIFFSSMTDDNENIDDILKFHLDFFYLINAHCLLKVIILVYKADDIWPLLDTACVHFLNSRNCRKHVYVLRKQRDLSKKISYLLCTLSTVASIQWALFPLFFNYTAEIPASKIFSSLNNVSCEIFDLEISPTWGFTRWKIIIIIIVQFNLICFTDSNIIYKISRRITNCW